MVDIANYRFTDVADRARNAYADLANLRTDRARMTAGNALAGGDFGSAARALYGAGDLESGSQVDAMGRQRQAATLKSKEDKQAAAWNLAGEMAGRLYGIVEQGGADEESSKTATARALNAFDSIYAPRFRELGETDAEISGLRGQLEANARDTLVSLGAAAAKTGSYAVDNVNGELVITDTRNGDIIRRYRPSQTLKLGAGESLYQIDGSGDPSQHRTPDFNPQVQAERPPPNMGDVGPAISGALPRNQRNRNPGNIEDGAFARSLPGYKGSDGRFAIFDTPEAGQAAQAKLLQSYGQRGFNSVQAIINRWAPPSDNNPTRSYIDFVARKLGVSPRETLDMANPQVIAALAGAIAEFEGGSSASNGAPAPKQEAAAPTGQGVRMLASRPKEEKPVARVATAEEKARYGIPDNVPAQIKPDGSMDVIDLPKGVADKEKADNARQAQVLKARDIISTVDSVLGEVGWGESGLVGQKMAGVAGTKAYDVARQIETIKSNLGFQELQEMRAMSPTGGALGAIAVQELVALQSTVASLDIGQSEQQLRANLQKVKTHYQRWLNAVGNGGGAKPPPKPQAAPKPAGDPTAATLAAARDAIAKGAPRAAVRKRLIDAGIDPKGI